MNKVFNLLLIIIIVTFFISTYYFYSSSKNIEVKKYNRKNIDKIIDIKISNVPILKNDTENVIEFNSGFQNQIEDSKPRNFWNLLKIK